MSWLFSQAVVEAYSAATCSDGEPSAQLNVMPTPHKFWRNDKTMEFSRLSQFGLTLRLLTEDHGEAVLTSFLAAFPARTSAPLGGGLGLDGARSGLWSEFRRIIREVRPRCVYVENSPMLTSRGLGRVLGDLAAMGFDAEWGVISAADTDADHLRERIWIVAYAKRFAGIERFESLLQWRRKIQAKQAWMGSGRENVADTGCGRRGRTPGGEVEQPRRAEIICSGEITSYTLRQGLQERQRNDSKRAKQEKRSKPIRVKRWPAEPAVGRVVNGLAHRVDRLKALGNGQVPRVAAAAWEILS